MSKLLKVFLVIGFVIIAFRVVIYINASQNINSPAQDIRKNKKAFIKAANQIVAGARMAAISNPSILSTKSTPIYINISAIKVAFTEKEASPFGKKYSSNSYVKIILDNNSKEYKYYICLVDTVGNGTNEIEINDLELDQVLLKKANCNPPNFDYTNQTTLYGE